MNRIDKESSAYQVVLSVQKNNTLVRGVLGLDKANGKLVMVKLN